MAHVPKHFINIGGKSLIDRVLQPWQGVATEFIFVVKKENTWLWQHLPPNSAVVFQDSPAGLANAILQAAPFVGDEKFVVALGDCIIRGRFDNATFDLGIGVCRTSPHELSKNFSVSVGSTGLISSLEEKPTIVGRSSFCGMGIYFMDSRLFAYIRRTAVKPSGGDLTHILQAMINEGEEIHPVHFHGMYINVGGPEDIIEAERFFPDEQSNEEAN